MHPGLRMLIVGSEESWKLLKQKYNLTNVCLRKVTEGRLEDRWIDGWVNEWVDGWMNKWMNG